MGTLTTMSKKERSRRTTQPRARGSLALIAAAALAAPLITRTALLLEANRGMAAPDLRGFLSDLSVALVLLGGLVSLLRASRWAPLLALVLWGIIHYANYEHVAALGSSAGLAQAHYLLDPTFFLGSVLAPTRPGLLAGMLGVSLLLGALAQRTPPSQRTGLVALLAGVLLLSLHAFWPRQTEAMSWRQENVVHENLRWLVQRQHTPALDDSAKVAQSAATRAVEALYRPDLSGTPIVSFGERGTHILLIMLEAISGAHLASIADHYGIPASVNLPKLDALAKNALLYRSFISHQRQTNRGEYAILCGDYPKLEVDEPKMTELLTAKEAICLPRVLRNAGYETVYLQSAPLGYMSKDAFMPRIGFTQTHGESFFDRAYARNRWGIDDRAFFEQSVAMVERLQATHKPWFLTLLTVGTHHPYLIPREANRGKNPFANAAHYLDDALATFLSTLKRRGLLENTLVLITSDESAGISGYRGAKRLGIGAGIDDLTKKLSDNWGILIVLLPGQEKRTIDAEFMQADLALSISDYLGLPEGTEIFPGRSVFREYSNSRPIVFANVYRRTVAALDPARNLLVCREDFSSCSSYDLLEDRIFSPARTKIETDLESVAFLKQMVARSRTSVRGRSGKRTIQLLVNPIVDVPTRGDSQVIFGGQYLTVEPYTRIDVDLELEAKGRSGIVSFSHLLKSGGRDYHFRRSFPPLRVGDRLVIHYSFTPDQKLYYLENLGMAQKHSGEDLALHFSVARMTLWPPEAGGETPAPGLELHEVALKPAATR